MKKLFLLLILCITDLYAQAEYVTNFVTDTDLYTAYTDVLDQEVESTTVLNKDWCDYLTNEDIEFGKRLAVLSYITHNSAEETICNSYQGEHNFNVYNAYILSKYNLPKADYSKMTVHDATIYNLLHQAGSNYDSLGQEDLSLMNNLRKRDPQSLTLAMLEVAMNKYYFGGVTGLKKIFKQARDIKNNYNSFTQDIQLSAVEVVLDKIIDDDPCSGNLFYDNALHCNCYSDDNENSKSFNEQVKCLETIQTQLKTNMSQVWDKDINWDYSYLWNKHSFDNWKLMKKSALSWLDTEINYINTLQYKTDKETKIRQIINTQIILRDVQHISVLSVIVRDNQSEYSNFIEERNPTFLEVYPNCQLSEDEDRNFTMDELTLIHTELERILDEVYNKLGGGKNKKLKKAQLAWEKSNTSRQFFLINEVNNEDKTDMDLFDYQFIYLDPLTSRIETLESYFANENEVDELPLYKHYYSKIYNMLKK